MSTRIRFRRDTAANWTSNNPTLTTGEMGYETDTGKFKIGNNTNAWTALAYSITAELSEGNLNDLKDVTITSAANGDFLRWNGTAWINDAVNLSTDTVGSFVESLVAGTGVTLSNNSGEGATPTVAVDTSVIQARVTNVTDTEIGYLDGVTSAIQTQIDTKAPLASPTFTGTVTLPDNTVALGTKTSGDYVASLVAGTGVTLSNNSGETATPTIAVTANTYDAYGAASTAASNAATALTNHEADTTSIHGIADTSILVTTTGSQTLTNKTITSPSGLVKGDVGLGSVDNTADTAKPVSTAQQTALDLKANIASPTFTGTVTIPSGASITAPTGLVKGDVGLGNADNTSDANKPVSTAQQTALDLKANLASPTFTGTVTVPTPTNSTDAVTKSYADAITQSLDIKDSVRVASTANITVASALTDTSTIDGVVVATGDRVLLKNQTTASQNGIYVVVASGAASRSTDANTSAKVTTGMYVFVSEGTVSADMGYVLTTNDSITLGTTALSFTQFSGAGQITAGTGISKSGNTLSIDTTVTTDLTTAQTLTNKTLTSPVVNTPTGIVKGDVGLGNVDNTSNATERAASATLTNKTLTSPVINTPTGIVKGDVGLGSVDNTADTAKPVSTAQQTALDLKANLASPTFTGTVTIPSGASISGFAPLASPELTGNPTATTQTAGNNTTRLATTAFVTDAVATGVAGASIDSLDEITDVTITSAASGQFLKWNGSAWVNDAIDLGTDTVGNYVNDLTAGTGISVTHTPGEGSSPTVAINATLDNLSNVTAPSPSDGEFLKYITSTEAVAGTGAVTWVTQPDLDSDVYAAAYGNNLWVAVMMSGYVSHSTDGLTWTSQTGSGSDTLSVAYGNNLWVAGGVNGQLLTSTNGTTWTTQTSNFGNTHIYSVAYGNNLWIAGGDASQLRTSTDAITWTTRTSNFGNTRINSVAYGNNLWVAVGGTAFGDAGQIRTSTDGTTWTTRTSNFGNAGALSVAYGNSLWVAVGGEYGTTGDIRTSTDGTTWTTRNSNFGLTPINSVAYGNNLWVAGGYQGQIRSSTDGTTWTTRTSNFGTNGIYSVAYGNNRWLAGGIFGSLRTSAVDVVSTSAWVNDPINLGTDTTGSYVTSLVAGTGVTLSGNSGEGATPTITVDTTVIAALASPTFTGTPTLPTGTIATTQSVADNSTKVATTAFVRGEVTALVNSATATLDTLGEIATALGNDANLSTTLTTSIGLKAPLASPTFTGTVVLPATTSIGTITNTELSYVDGVTSAIQTQIDAKQATLVSATSIKTINGSSLLGSGDLTVGAAAPTTTSVTANTATTIDSFVLATYPSAEFTVQVTQGSRRYSSKALALHNGTTVDLAQYGELSIAATELTTWTTQTSNFGTTSIRSVAYGNSLWVAGGGSGQLRTSTDGTTWTTQTSNFGGGYGTEIRSVAYNNSLWVAGGQSGQIRTSTDAITWTTRESNFGATNIISVAYGNSLWVAAGYAGQLRTSTDAVTWTTRTSNFGTTVIFSVAYGNSLWVAAGNTGQLRTSTDATTWTTQTSNFGNTAIYSIAFGNNLWVAGGDTGQLRTSTDAITWTTRTPNTSNGIYFVAYGNNIWVVGSALGEIRTSTDGTTWTTQTSNFGTTSIRSVAYGNNLWVASGDTGQLRTSTMGPVTVPLTLSADISGSDVRLRATITDAATTNAEVKVLKTVL